MSNDACPRAGTPGDELVRLEDRDDLLDAAARPRGRASRHLAVVADRADHGHLLAARRGHGRPPPRSARRRGRSPPRLAPSFMTIIIGVPSLRSRAFGAVRARRRAREEAVVLVGRADGHPQPSPGSPARYRRGRSPPASSALVDRRPVAGSSDPRAHQHEVGLARRKGLAPPRRAQLTMRCRSASVDARPAGRLGRVAQASRAAAWRQRVDVERLAHLVDRLDRARGRPRRSRRAGRRGRRSSRTCAVTMRLARERASDERVARRAGRRTRCRPRRRARHILGQAVAEARDLVGRARRRRWGCSGCRPPPAACARRPPRPSRRGHGRRRRSGTATRLGARAAARTGRRRTTGSAWTTVAPGSRAPRRAGDELARAVADRDLVGLDRVPLGQGGPQVAGRGVRVAVEPVEARATTPGPPGSAERGSRWRRASRPRSARSGR